MGKTKNKIKKISVFLHEAEMYRWERECKRLTIACVTNTVITAASLIYAIKSIIR